MAEEWKQQPFTVDSALLRELGERLVGAPYVALAELIKNSYDADAEHVRIKFTPSTIVITDDGHGMNLHDFESRWMRVGSPHKATIAVSPRLHRPLTGSKGVGRLAVQFLGARLRMRTRPLDAPTVEIQAKVNWDEAVTAGELTTASADFREVTVGNTPSGPSLPGTEIIIEELRHEWSANDFQNLARQIWHLRPPFNHQTPGSFDVELVSPNPDDTEAFEKQLDRVLDIWEARITGQLVVSERQGRRFGEVAVSLQFAGSDTLLRQTIAIPDDPPPQQPADECLLDACSFEIRVFDLRGKQRFGIDVASAREYLNEYGGVHIYDGGFRIPLEGAAKDWLRLEQDHAHRLVRSALLPKELQLPGATSHLPTNSRVFGTVQIDTANEARAARELREERNAHLIPPHLQIQISRDRLVRNEAFDQLHRVVRWAIDYYAVEQARRRIADLRKTADVLNQGEPLEHAEETLRVYRNAVPTAVYQEITSAITKVRERERTERDLRREFNGQLVALATAGMMAVAYDHEVAKQVGTIRAIAAGLRTGPTDRAQSSDETLADQLEAWVERADGLRRLVAHLADEENRTAVSRFLAVAVVSDAVNAARPITRGVRVDIAKLDPEIRLPEASYAGWIALFHNVLANAANAVLESRAGDGVIEISSRISGTSVSILVQDTGIGLDWQRSERLFEAFVRHASVSPDRRRLGAGGTGLGLTLVRLLAEDAGSTVAFEAPKAGFATCFSLSWIERS